MNKLLLAFSVLLSLSWASVAQQSKCDLKNEDVLISKDKPTLYLTYEGIGNIVEQTSQSSRRSIKVIWLSFHNNSRWAIIFPLEKFYSSRRTAFIPLSNGTSVLGVIDGSKVEIRYDVEAQQGIEWVRLSNGKRIARSPRARVPALQWGDIASFSWLAPGNSFIFPIPLKYLGKNLQVYVSFQYEWETTATNSTGTGEPQHRLFFRSVDLPQELQ